MTNKTRRSILLTLVILMLAIPAESILLQALTTPSPAAAARTWAATLSPAALAAAADRVQEYPFAYRKEILRALTPEARAAVWRDHLQAYLDAHPEFDETVIITIRAAMSLATAEAFQSTTPASVKSRVGLVAEQIESLLGRDEALFLMYRLGPADGQFSSVEPVTHKLANFVRRLAVVTAGEGEDCNCNTGFGCSSGDTHCSTSVGCAPDTEWPACGWWWNEDCDGVCVLGREM